MTPEQEQLILDNLDAAKRVATKFSYGRNAQTYTWDEYYSICLEALTLAALKWDESRWQGTFTSFAIIKMYNFINDTFRREMKWDKRTKTFRIESVSMNSVGRINHPNLAIEFKDKENTSRNRELTVPYFDNYGYEMTESLRQHLAKLSERDRKVLVDFANGGVDYAAQQNGITKGRVSQIRTKAREMWELNLHKK